MKTREEIFNEVIHQYKENSEFYIFIHVVKSIEFIFWIYPFDAIIKGCVCDCEIPKYKETRKVAKTGDFEDDLYYLIDSLIEDAKEAQML